MGTTQEPGAADRSELAARITSELFAIPLPDARFLIYAPLRQSAFVGNAAMVNLLADLAEQPEHVGSQPPWLDLLRRLQIVDAGPEPSPITSFEGEPAPTMVTLFLTTACNLRCTYCYASAGDAPERSMDLEAAQRGIRFVADNAARLGRSHFEIAYHGGGEPTSNWQVMTKSLDYAREIAVERGLAVHAAAASNGVLSRQQLDWIVANLHSVSISFDGLPQAHDTHRLTVLGQGSSHLVIKSLERFDAARFRYGLRMTVTRDQIAALPASVEFVCSRFRPVRIQVEPAYQLGRWREAPSAETEDFIEAFRSARLVARKRGFELTYSAARVGLLTNHFCGVTQDGFALSADGNVSGCYEVFSESDKLADTFFYGRPSAAADGYEFNMAALQHLRGQSVDAKAFCKGCYAKWHCAGDCLNKSLTVNGMHEPFAGSDRCHITRELTKDQILDRIAAGNGLFWHEPRTTPEPIAAGKEILP